MELLNNIVDFLNEYIWSTPMLIFVLGSGLYFSFRLRFTQVRNFKDMVHNVISNERSESGISTFASFWMNMSARVGVGNIAGVSTAIYMGGPGAVFWMWVTSILLSATAFTECSLAQLYKIRVDGEYRGGAYYCGERGLGWKWFGVLFAVVAILALMLTQPGVQSYMISEGLNHSMGIPYWITGLVGAAALGVIIFGGVRSISKYTSVLVPIKVGSYILLTIVVLIIHAKEVPHMFATIFSAAFNQGSVFGGMIGSAISMGIRRATFASGAGMGEEPPSAAAAEADHPIGQGLANSFGIYVDILVVTCTALMILAADTFNTASGYIGSGSPQMAELAKTGQSGVVFPQEAIGSFMPGAGEIIIGILVVLFAFTSILGNYYQAETALAYLCGDARPKIRKNLILGMKILLVLVYFFFSTTSSSVVWGLADLGAGVMVWLNVFMLWFLFPKVVIMLKDYEAQRKAGKKPFFDPDKVGIKNVELWNEINKEKIAAAKAEYSNATGTAGNATLPF